MADDDRALRDRIETLEVANKKLVDDAAAMREALTVPTAPVFAAERRESEIYEWVGSLPQPIALVLFIVAATLPLVSFALKLDRDSSFWLILLGGVFSPIFTFGFLISGYRSARTMHRLRAAARLSRKD